LRHVGLAVRCSRVADGSMVNDNGEGCLIG